MLLQHPEALSEETVKNLQAKREALRFIRKKHKPSVVQLEDEEDDRRAKYVAPMLGEALKRRVSDWSSTSPWSRSEDAEGGRSDVVKDSHPSVVRDEFWWIRPFVRRWGSPSRTSTGWSSS